MLVLFCPEELILSSFDHPKLPFSQIKFAESHQSGTLMDHS